MLGRDGQTIKTTLQVSKEARIIIDANVGSTSESVDNFQLVENIPLFDNDNEDEEFNVEVADHDPLLGGGRGGVWGVYFEGVGSMPQNVVSETGPTSNASFHDGSDLKVDQIFVSKKLLQAKLHNVAMEGYFEYKVAKSNKTLYVVECINKNCKWRVCGFKLHNYRYLIIRKYHGTHNCSLVGRNMNHRQATYKMIGRKFKSQYLSVFDGPTPKVLVGLVRENLKVGVSY